MTAALPPLPPHAVPLYPTAHGRPAPSWIDHTLATHPDAAVHPTPDRADQDAADYLDHSTRGLLRRAARRARDVEHEEILHAAATGQQVLHYGYGLTDPRERSLADLWLRARAGRPALRLAAVTTCPTSYHHARHNPLLQDFPLLFEPPERLHLLADNPHLADALDLDRPLLMVMGGLHRAPRGELDIVLQDFVPRLHPSSKITLTGIAVRRAPTADRLNGLWQQYTGQDGGFVHLPDLRKRLTEAGLVVETGITGAKGPAVSALSLTCHPHRRHRTRTTRTTTPSTTAAAPRAPRATAPPPRVRSPHPSRVESALMATPDGHPYGTFAADRDAAAKLALRHPGLPAALRAAALAEETAVRHAVRDNRQVLHIGYGHGLHGQRPSTWWQRPDPALPPVVAVTECQDAHTHAALMVEYPVHQLHHDSEKLADLLTQPDLKRLLDLSKPVDVVLAGLHRTPRDGLDPLLDRLLTRLAPDNALAPGSTLTLIGIRVEGAPRRRLREDWARYTGQRPLYLGTSSASGLLTRLQHREQLALLTPEYPGEGLHAHASVHRIP
ncbi:SAM-dependent methyltransferase [Kitasatospora sp. NPDC088134]|uniref:SAM-dependent methyltransferase n=1 Tax=Kitasatospora sp. NPDC088134 TaxID=3364071 RepID=UPI0037F97E3F